MLIYHGIPYAWFCSNSFQAQPKLINVFHDRQLYYSFKPQAPLYTCQNSQRQSHEFDFTDCFSLNAIMQNELLIESVDE